MGCLGNAAAQYQNFENPGSTRPQPADPASYAYDGDDENNEFDYTRKIMHT